MFMMASNEKGVSCATGSYEYKTSALPSIIALFGQYLRLRIQMCLLSGFVRKFSSLSIFVILYLFAIITFIKLATSLVSLTSSPV